MENQQQNWFSKNKIMLAILAIITILIVLNWGELSRGFIDGYNSGK
jgi:predicted negative regulator of RcsB-dependent stress response